MRGNSYQSGERVIRKGYFWLIISSALLVFVGAFAQFAIKTQSLAGLRDADFWSTVPLYIQTAAGSATMYRIIAVAIMLIVFLIGRKKILSSAKITIYEILMLLAMCGFEYFRAVISHASANPFYPHLSVGVNFIHLIEKDFWAGAVGVLLFMALSKRLRQLLSDLIPKASLILAIDLAAVSVTACYIVWLHLKSFDNLFTTQWGEAFLQLLIIAILLVGMRLYHIFARLYWPQGFAKLLPMSLAAEFAFGILIVYCSSVVIITSPPLQQAHAKTYSAQNQGVLISLGSDTSEDGSVLLAVSGGKNLQTPTVIIEDEVGGVGALDVKLFKRFNNGYAFPTSFLAGTGPFKISIIVPQTGGYDAQTTFEVPKGTYDSKGAEPGRSFDSFTIIMIVIALSSLLFAALVYHFSSLPSGSLSAPTRQLLPELSAVGVFLAASFLGANLITAFDASALSNPYKAECIGDGNMWHLMLPSRAGVPVSQTPREGCMWGMGDFMYQFPDKREYDFYRKMDTAGVTLEHTPQNLTTGVPTTLKIVLKNADGSPATLFVDMEKYIHVVIVSKDETVFSHVHPDDTRPLTQEEISGSTFTVPYTFPKAGKYLISVDYAHGLQLESKQFTVEVSGSPAQESQSVTYKSPGEFQGYDVSLDYQLPYAGEVTTLRFDVMKNGNPVRNMTPYLGAVAHISIVKNDLSAFVHTHGEIHPPGVPYPPIIVRDGKIIHAMSAMMAPAKFGSKFESHVIFPAAGFYTVWAQFRVDGKVIPANFTVRVEGS